MINFHVFLRPRLIAFSGVFILVLLAWTYLSVMAGHRITFTQMTFSSTQAGAFHSIGLLGSMWVVMAIAMMLPTAVPMISAYVEICETAKAKSISTVSPFVLMAGYVFVWLIFSLTVAAVQIGLIKFASLSPAFISAHQGVASVMLVGAGVYQFTSLKQACLTKCRAPLGFFFANWSDRPLDIFKLGLHQGLFCLGCCWALMLLMFVTGIMNVLWMVALTLLMVVEKTIPNPDGFRRFTGFALVGWGAIIGIRFIIT